MDKALFDECEKCLQDEPAASTARCPVHVDAALFSSEMEKGDFQKVYQVLAKKIPFAGIIGMICDHPCEKACVRGALDSPVNLGEMERAAVRYGYAPFKKSAATPKKIGTAAVVGGGISGLTAAVELDRKGFSVTIYEQAERLGGRIWDSCGKQISREMIEQELQVIDRLGIDVRYAHKVNRSELDALTQEYDAVFIGTGEWARELPADRETFQVFNRPLFGKSGPEGETDSVIYAVSAGKRAAVSMERFVKKISLTAMREREGSFETPFRQNLDDVEPLPAIEKTGDFYTEEEAVKEAARCLKCKCSECIKACSHLKKFGMTAKTYARQIQINENVIMGTRYANTMINSCTLCGLCKEECPQGIDIKEVIRQTREGMVEKSKMPPSAHDFALRDMEFCGSEQFYLVKSPPPIKPEDRERRERELFTYPRISFSNYAKSVFKGDKPGREDVDYLFFPGCQLAASAPSHVEKSYRYLLSHIKEGVGLMLGCCGAPADWAGRQDLMRESTDRFRAVWEEAGKPVFILACASCKRVFEQYLPEISCISLWEVFRQYGLPETARTDQGYLLNVHDACAARYHRDVQESVRSLASAVGCEIKELRYAKEKTKCCGYGGLVYYANREQAADFVRDRLAESPETLLVYCAMCKDLFAGKGKKVFHILDLLFAENPEETAMDRMPNLSQRNANRAALKTRLLKELWEEELKTQGEGPDENQLIIPETIWEAMEKRLILYSDIEKVVRHSKTTGERFFHAEDASYLANLRIKNVTYWVRYAEQEDGIHVLGAYSHRMEVGKE